MDSLEFWQFQESKGLLQTSPLSHQILRRCLSENKVRFSKKETSLSVISIFPQDPIWPIQALAFQILNM